MSTTGSVKIGPQFFQKELREYRDWNFALIREFVQNCVDAPGTRKIHIDIRTEGQVTRVVVQNDGAAMTHDILVGKLLTLGESGKTNGGTVGGFGKAKVVLYFAHQCYEIHTGDLHVVGAGGDYSLHKREHFPGTRSEIVLHDDQTENLINEAKRLAMFMQWDGELYLNGVLLETNFRKGAPRRTLPFGTVYTSTRFENKLVVRIGGIPMYIDYVSVDRCVLVELSGSSLDLLTSNRDGLTGKHAQTLRAFCDELAIDKASALRAERLEKYQLFDGDQFCHKKERTPEPSLSNEMVALLNTPEFKSLVEKEAAKAPQEEQKVLNVPGDDHHEDARVECRDQGRQRIVERVVERALNRVNSRFIVKNDLDMVVPDCYLPSSQDFGNYSLRLVTFWGRILVQLHKLFEKRLASEEERFSIGFVFSAEAEAEHEKTDKYGRVYYINPVKVVEQNYTNSRSLKKRFSQTQRDYLITLGAHEFVHGLGYSYHDERYANVFTDVMAAVMENRASFNWCFK